MVIPDQDPMKWVGRVLGNVTDQSLIDQFSAAFISMHVLPTNVTAVREVKDLIHSKKFEGFVLDTTLANDSIDLLSEIRESASNRHAMVFALTSAAAMEVVKKEGANFVLEKPLQDAQIIRTVKASYGMIVRDWRRYFRHPVKVPATIQAPVTGTVQGETVDLSEGGMAVHLPYSFGVGMEVFVRFKLPDHSTDTIARAGISRTEENGTTGLHFLQVPQKSIVPLQEWLSLRLEETFPALSGKSDHH